MNDWDEFAEKWDADPATQLYAERAYATLMPILARRGLSLQGASVMDFGCGTGLLTGHLIDAGASVDAVDTSPGMLRVLAAKAERLAWPGVRALAAVPVTEPSYDLIVCSSVCAFLEDYPGTARELAALLVPGGVFVQWDWEAHEAEIGSHGLTREGMLRALVSAGLEDAVVESSFEIEVDGQIVRPLFGQAVLG